MDQVQRQFRAFRLHALLTLIALVLEFILGMYTALFVEFPESLINGNAWGWSMTQSPVLLSHIILGTLMLLMSLSAFSFSIRTKNRTAIVTAVIGLIMVGIAFLSGSAFLSDIKQDGYSFSMSLGFIGAMVAYGAAYYLTRPSGQAAS
jgi:heme A synthase